MKQRMKKRPASQSKLLQVHLPQVMTKFSILLLVAGICVGCGEGSDLRKAVELKAVDVIGNIA